MKNILGVITLCGLLLTGSLSADAYDRKVYNEALDLYQSGMYERALQLFASQKDPVCRDYAVLCNIKAGHLDCDAQVKALEESSPSSVIRTKVYFEYAGLLFAQGRYVDAGAQYAKVKTDRLSEDEIFEAEFKLGYCEYAQGHFQESEIYFKSVASYKYSQYTAPSRFALGIITYLDSRFQEAIEWFTKAGEDDRFKETADFYIADCKFMLHDYKAAVALGESIYVTSNQKRQAYLSRILSESYLILGQNKKAKEYLQKEDEMGPSLQLGYEDYFRRASVLYAVGEYESAIDNFTKMVNPDDSIGQIACYELGYSYIRTKNKVGAMDAFKVAARLDYDHTITEDACFNYAKLAFELNNDDAPFREYAYTFSSAGKRDEVYRYLALSALKSKNYTEAVSCYDEIENLGKEDQLNYTKASFQRSAELLESGSYKDAIKYLKCVPHFLDKNDALAKTSRYWLADTYYRIGDYKESLKVYTDLYYSTDVSANDAMSVMLPYNMGFCYYRLRDFTSGAKCFDLYIQTRDKTAREDALVRRADCDFERAEYAAAAKHYQKAVDEFPKNLYAVYYQSVAYSLTGKRRERAECLSKVLYAEASAPYYIDCLNALGQAYADLDRNDDAASVFEKLGQVSKERTVQAMSQMGLGMVARNKGDLDGAQLHYKKVVSLVPGSSYCDDALQALLAVNQMNGTPEEYLNYIDSLGLGATQSDDDRRKMLFANAEQIYMAGNYGKAVSSLESFLVKYPQGEYVPEAYYYLGDASKHLSRKEIALECFVKCMEVSQTSSCYELSLMNAASISYSLQRYQEALGYYMTLSTKTKIASNVPLSQIGIMRSAYRCKDYSRAIPACEWVAAHGDTDDLKREALFVQAKSCLSLSRREEAFKILAQLSEQPATAEGAEACYMLLQSDFDSGKYDGIETAVYDFASKCGEQTYWLARAYILLGDVFMEKDNAAQAKVTYESIRDGYQSGPEGDDIMEIVNAKLSALQ